MAQEAVVYNMKGRVEIMGEEGVDVVWGEPLILSGYLRRLILGIPSYLCCYQLKPETICASRFLKI